MLRHPAPANAMEDNAIAILMGMQPNLFAQLQQ
jgi:hypothetical protein